MLPDAKWLDALRLPLKTSFGTALASGLLLIFDSNGLLSFDSFGAVVRPSVISVCVVSSSLAAVGIADMLLEPLREKYRRSKLSTRRAVRREEVKSRSETHEREVIARIDDLSAEELYYVADCLKKGTPTFYAWCYSPAIAILRGKGFVWAPAGAYHQDHHPFSFYDFAWKALLTRKNELLAKHEAHKREKKNQR